ncbi:NAD(P)/FAD-dependent oxidoreductase [Granulicella sibirica]|uniref:Glycine oxidase ThiO n=1 Tax=Granulicella sibirica TaxID=2479048 RepID=A0A4V1L5Z0_9BACT|nr:FAD-dependent oxidoreductase [Granulicella sibirica]RXH57434.1 Glycine oxidase ThiO [Granulicella sibirica]
MRSSDFCIAGGGIIGLTLALELHRRGAEVTVVERDIPLKQASQAAAGMLAVRDPDNPPELLPLSELSIDLYPAFLDRIERLSGQRVPFQTTVTYQSVGHSSLRPAINLPTGLIPGDDGLSRLEEHSLDPRQLAPALLTAVRNTSVVILDHTTIESAPPAGCLISTLGPWGAPPAAPRKGQMLAVSVPASFGLDYVVRTEHIYIVPRLQGPRAGQAVIGATVEDAGFSTHTEPASLARLRGLAAAFLPAVADETDFPIVDHWAGLRPYTPDNLPMLGEIEAADPGSTKRFVATGHYRNGILLAPATAHVMAELLTGEVPSVDLCRFAPGRFGKA